MQDWTRIRTLGELKRAGYRSRSVKQELRENLIAALREGRPLFQGIYDYEDTVLPQLRTAILAQHNILLLGLRGQAKTRLSPAAGRTAGPLHSRHRGGRTARGPFQPDYAAGTGPHRRSWGRHADSVDSSGGALHRKAGYPRCVGG